MGVVEEAEVTFRDGRFEGPEEVEAEDGAHAGKEDVPAQALLPEGGNLFEGEEQSPQRRPEPSRFQNETHPVAKTPKKDPQTLTTPPANTYDVQGSPKLNLVTYNFHVPLHHSRIPSKGGRRQWREP